MRSRTSHSHPLKIATVNTAGGGRIGMTFCPGKHDPAALTGSWARDLETDLATIVSWGAAALVTLLEEHELGLLHVTDLGEKAQSLGLAWYHLPIRDVSIPTPAFEAQWVSAGDALRKRLLDGQSIVVHCRGGLGRTGMIAARLLIELGETPARALKQVRAVRPGAVQTLAQEEYVLNTLKNHRS